MVIGLDLGQAADYTAIAIAQIAALPAADRAANQAPNGGLGRADFELLVRNATRLPLRLPYPQQVGIVADLVESCIEIGPTLLVVDHTGVGRPVVDLLRASRIRCAIWPVTIATSAMQSPRRDPATGEWVVPKKDLVGSLLLLAQSGRLRISREIALPRALEQELLAFRASISSSGRLTYEAWREGEHDDLVLALALACWASHRWIHPGGLS